MVRRPWPPWSAEVGVVTGRGVMSISFVGRVAKFHPKVGSWVDNQNKKSGCPRHYFGCPHFVTLLYVCGTSSHTALFVGKRKITCWDENFSVNSFIKNLVVRRTTRPQLLVVLT